MAATQGLKPGEQDKFSRPCPMKSPGDEMNRACFSSVTVCLGRRSQRRASPRRRPSEYSGAKKRLVPRIPSPQHTENRGRRMAAMTGLLCQECGGDSWESALHLDHLSPVDSDVHRPSDSLGSSRGSAFQMTKHWVCLLGTKPAAVRKIPSWDPWGQP